MMFRKILVFILCISMILLPISSASGQTNTSTTGTFLFVEKGGLVPFSGTLFDDVAIAIILTDKETKEKEFQLKLEYEIGKIRSRYELENNTLKLDLVALKKEAEMIIDIKNKQIDETTKIAAGSNDWTWLYVSLAAIVGVALGGGLVYVVMKVEK